jgi:hypothetical protein
LTSDTLEEVHDFEFDQTKGSKDENENLKDVRGIQLSNAMKNMDIGELKPRHVIDDVMIKCKCYPTQMCNNQASSSGSHDNDEDQVASTSSQSNDQASASSNVPILQPTYIARDHPLDTIIEDISRGVQTRSRLILFCEHFLFVSSIEPKKIEEVLIDIDWVDAMHEELNNFISNQVWELVERPKNHNVIGTKWVYRNKQDQDR